MSDTVRAIIKIGKIEPLEHVNLSDGTKLLIMMLSDEDAFWQEASQTSLKRIWDNKADDIYAP